VVLITENSPEFAESNPYNMLKWEFDTWDLRWATTGRPCYLPGEIILKILRKIRITIAYNET